MSLALRCLQVGITLSLAMTGAVLAFLLPPRSADGTPAPPAPRAVSIGAVPDAPEVMGEESGVDGEAGVGEESGVDGEPDSAGPHYSRVGYATRVFADPATGVFQITREPCFALETGIDGAPPPSTAPRSSEVVAIEAPYCEQIPDHFGWGEVEVSEHRYRMAGREIRMLLYKWGPPESQRDLVGDSGLPLPRLATTELTLWIDGKARMIGPLTDSVAEMMEQPVFDTVLVQLLGEGIFVRASRREGGISRRGEGRISLLTEPPQIAFPGNLLEEEEPGPVPASEPTGDVAPDDVEPSRIALSVEQRPTRPRSRRRPTTREVVLSR
ncbi:MAG: hypothetical protein ACKO0W_14065 [Planctomycetota bacterium]